MAVEAEAVAVRGKINKMKLIHLKDIPVTKAHDEIERQRFIAPNELQSNIQTVNYVELGPGESYTPHRHPDCEECFFALEGEATAFIESKGINITKGDFLVVEKNEEHSFKNETDKVFVYFAFRILI